METTFICPKCGVVLTANGTLTVDGEEYPVFQCDICLVATPIFGDVAYTFIVVNGVACDPDSI